MTRNVVVAVAVLALFGCRRDRGAAMPGAMPGAAGSCAVDEDCLEAQQHCREHAGDRGDVDELPHARDACMDAGERADRAGDLAMAGEAYRLACELGDARACAWSVPSDEPPADAAVPVAAAPEVVPAEPVAAEPAAAPTVEPAAPAVTCDRRDPESCYQQGLAASDEDAPGWMKQACEGGHTQGCLAYGEALESGHWIDQDELEATVVYWRLCEADVDEGCKRAVMIAERNPTASRLLDTMAERRRAQATALQARP
jgi:TPR repeat protein